MAKLKEIRVIKENKSLSNVLTPFGGLEFKRSSFRMGEIFGEVYTIIKYPKEVKMGWIEEISSVPNTITSFCVIPTDKEVLMQKISKGKFDNENQLEGVTDEILRQRLEREIEDAREIINRLDTKGETLVYFVLSIMVFADTEEQLKDRGKILNSKLISSMNSKGRKFVNIPINAFRHIAPFAIADKIIKKIASRNMLETTWIGGFPFSSSGFNDEISYYFAKDTSGGAIVLDLWKRGGDRTNSNVVIMGTAGVGKSTVAKHLILKEFMIGTKVIMIDPEAEYKDLTNNLGGKWIDVGSGRGGIINPLQIKQVPLDDDNNYLEEIDEKKGMGAMALHFQTLHTFFKLHFNELTSSDEAVLDEVLEKLYNKFNIFWNTDISKIPNDKFPILSDLYELIGEEIKIEKEEIRKQILVNLRGLLRGICIGAESSLFNGITTIDTDSSIICFDTFNLQNASEKVKKAQYFNILTYCWELMSKDKEEKTMLVCDEAYLLIDPNVLQSIVFLRNVSKRCRKYEGSLVIISHSIVDFLADSVRMYGQAVLDMACIKILMGTDGQNLEDSKNIFKLTDANTDFLYKKQRNMGILIIGTNRVYANFLLKERELRLFGKGGGR